MRVTIFLLCFCLFLSTLGKTLGKTLGQTPWQQRVNYTIQATLNAKTHALKGTLRAQYYNNSPDTLAKVYFHLYYNAFQPNSQMDVRSRLIQDPDPRVMDRIYKLQANEQGYMRLNQLKQDGNSITSEGQGTLLTVFLQQPLLPGQSSVFSANFDAQVPLQIRRTGRQNKENIAYSMAQWYPKLAEYDAQGWQTHDYVGREFHGVWGDYDVKLTLPKDYVVAATGINQNATQNTKFAENTNTRRLAFYSQSST